MIRMLLVFAVVFGLFYFGIFAVREMTGKEKWALTKMIGYCTLCTVLTLVLLSTIVILF